MSAENSPSTIDGSYPDVDERIKAAALLALTDAATQSEYRDFILSWLRPMPEGLSAVERAGWWERRWMAVNALVDVRVGAEAIALLEDLQAEDGAPAWVSAHVPRALETQQGAE